MRSIGIIIAVLAFTVCGQWYSEQGAANIITQPAKVVRGDSIVYVAAKCYPKHNGKSLISCRGAVVNPTGSAGYLRVHPKYGTATERYDIYLNNDGIPVGFEFDYIDSNGTTVVLDTSLYIFPWLYTN